MRFGVHDVEVKMPFPQRPRTLDKIPMFQVRSSLTLLESGELKTACISKTFFILRSVVKYARRVLCVSLTSLSFHACTCVHPLYAMLIIIHDRTLQLLRKWNDSMQSMPHYYYSYYCCCRLLFHSFIYYIYGLMMCVSDDLLHSVKKKINSSTSFICWIIVILI